MIHRLLVQQVLHRHAVENLLCYDLLVELSCAQSDEVTRLSVHRVLLVANLHHRCLELDERLVHHVTRADHLVYEDWARLQLIK